MKVNGVVHPPPGDPRRLLSDHLRHDLGLTGTHVGCEHGVCGCCTVLFDGAPVRSCLMLAVQAEGHDVTTIEGLAVDGAPLHPVQQAFHECHGLQCGFCTPGFVMSVVGLLAQHPSPTEQQVEEGIAGNLCRCTGYASIRRSVHRAAELTHANESGALTTRWFGQRVQRVEDDRLLRGHGRFTDDINENGERALESCLVRSPLAHARIRSIDVSAARALPGVVAVYTAADLPFGQTDLPILIPHPNLTHGRTQRCLASEVVRYAGEAVAFIVADSRYVAEDAADLVEVEYEQLPVVITPEIAARAEHLVHDDVPGNVAAEMLQEVGDVTRALAAAPHRKRLHFRFERGAASPMEARAVWARWSKSERRLTMYDSTQSPTSIRGGLAVLFGLPESSVEVIAPDVGGGFGPKIMLFYPDELLVPFAAMQLGRPVKWTEDRQEHFTAVNQERGQVHDVEVGFDAEGRVSALSVDFIHDAGAYTPYGIILPIITAGQVPGPYRVPNYRVRFRDVYTNATPTSPYRGAGRPHACFVMERTLDAIAMSLGLDRAEVRRRNLIQPDQFPYEVGVAWQDGNTVIYDSGNYPALLEKVLANLGPRPAGDNVGMGLGMYVEGTGSDLMRARMCRCSSRAKSWRRPASQPGARPTRRSGRRSSPTSWGWTWRTSR